jgi:transporter family-2 protein
VADVDPSLVQKIFYIPQGKWKPDIHHHRKADDLGTRLKITKWAALCHGFEPRARPPTAQGRFNLTLPLWFLIPGVLGTFFVFASITGYQTVGAAPTIAVLVASQLVIGLVWDMTRSEDITLQGMLTALLGASLLVGGVFIIASRNA